MLKIRKCILVFSVIEVKDWCPDGADATAICPYCAVDSVIPDASGWPLTAEFLAEMRCRWFSF